jgi:hypothetical protein
LFGTVGLGISVRGLGGDGTGGSADDEPFGGAGDPAPDGAASGNAQRVISFAGECGGLGFFVGKIALSYSQFRLAGFAFESKVVERFEVFRGN